MAEALEEFGGLDGPVWEGLEQNLFYTPGSFDDPEAFRQLAERLAELDRTRGLPGNHLFYLAVPPRFIPAVVENLVAAGLLEPGPGAFRRVVIEKPFGEDLASAVALGIAQGAHNLAGPGAGSAGGGRVRLWCDFKFKRGGA